MIYSLHLPVWMPPVSVSTSVPPNCSSLCWILKSPRVRCTSSAVSDLCITRDTCDTCYTRYITRDTCDTLHHTDTCYTRYITRDTCDTWHTRPGQGGLAGGEDAAAVAGSGPAAAPRLGCRLSLRLLRICNICIQPQVSPQPSDCAPPWVSRASQKTALRPQYSLRRCPAPAPASPGDWASLETENQVGRQSM